MLARYVQTHKPGASFMSVSDDPEDFREVLRLELRDTPIKKPFALAIGSSTGGPQALVQLLPLLKGLTQPIFVTQHMPGTFLNMLAEHIAVATEMPCLIGQDGMAVQGGHIYLAPGDHHMTIEDAGVHKVIRLNQNPPENFCRPAVDPMLTSLAEAYANRLFVIILTGMGKDGLRGCQKVVEKGGAVIAQDEKTSVVWGMPGAVARAGVCHEVLAIDKMGAFIKDVAQRGRE